LLSTTLCCTQYSITPAALVMLLALTALSPPFSRPLSEESDSPPFCVLLVAVLPLFCCDSCDAALLS